MIRGEENLQDIAEELDYSFFLCDETLSSWYRPSSSLLRLFRWEEPEPEPFFWREFLAVPFEEFREMTLALKENPGKISLALPFRLDGEENVMMTLRFSPLKKGEDGRPYRIGALERESQDIHYKLKAIQARDNEIEISARIQKILLTESVPLSLRGLSVAAETIPSREVDGDFYEFLPLAPGITDFIIGDVMGKGVPAALLAAAVKASYYKSLIHKELGGETRGGIGSVLMMIDSLIGENLMDIRKFLTLYYCRLDTNDFLLHFIDAGHTPFLYYDYKEGTCWSIKGANMPMGFASGQDYRRFLLPFGKGDRFLFYSDGVSEVRNSEGEMFGTDRLRKLVKAHGYLEPQDLIKKMINVIFFYSEGTFDDDVTAVSFMITAEDPPQLKERGYVLKRGDAVSLEAIRETFLEDLQECYGKSREEVLLKLTIAMMEACSNGISFTRGDIRLQWQFSRTRAVTSLEFSGPEFDWIQKTGSPIGEYRERGYGSSLIYGGTDSSLLLQGDEERKKLILVKEFP